jgi:PleD family two-component response regulator
MVYGFVRQSGGQVRIYSSSARAPPCASTCPASGSKRAEPTSPADFGVPGRQGETVLVVDDEPTMRMLIVEVLSRAGYAAIEAPTAPA